MANFIDQMFMEGNKPANGSTLQGFGGSGGNTSTQDGPPVPVPGAPTGPTSVQKTYGDHQVKVGSNTYSIFTDGAGIDWVQNQQGTWTPTTQGSGPWTSWAQPVSTATAKNQSGIKWVKGGDGSWYAQDVNPDGTLGNVVQSDIPPEVSPNMVYKSAPDGLHSYDPATGTLGPVVVPKQIDPALSALRSMQVQLDQSKISLVPSQEALNKARTGQANATAGLDVAKTAQTQAMTPFMQNLDAARASASQASSRLSDAKANVAVAPIWAKFEGEVARLQELRDSGVLTPDQYQSQVGNLYNTAVQEAKTGLTSDKLAAYTDSQNQQLTSEFNNAEKDIMAPAMKYGVGSAADIRGALGSLLGNALAFRQAGGGTLDLSGNGPLVPGSGGGSPLSGFMLNAASTANGGSSGPTMTYDPNTDNTHPVGSTWNGSSGWQSSGAPTGIPGNFMNIAGGGGAAGALMNMFQQRVKAGEDPNAVATSLMNIAKQGMGGSGGGAPATSSGGQ